MRQPVSTIDPGATVARRGFPHLRTVVTERSRTTHVVAAAALLGLLFPRDVHAYLDPGAGSLVFQTVIATLVAVAYGVRLYWGKLKAVLTRRAPVAPAELAQTAPNRDR
jgi:O-antigen/teichoic acid export membrane protein